MRLKSLSSKALWSTAAAVVLAACASTAAFAETLKGKVDVVNQGNKTLVVAGITFQTTTATTYNEALKAFENLQHGQKVTVEFDRSGSNLYTAKAIALEP